MDALANRPPFGIVQAEGRAPLVLCCDHASAHVPDDLAGLGLPPAELERHIAIDIGAAELARGLAEILDAPCLLAGFSRLVIDANRALDDPTLVVEVSDGTVVPGNRHLGAAAVAARVARFHAPYHAALAELVAGRRTASGAPAVVAIHSFTPVMRGHARPWHVGILWNRDGRMALPIMASLGAEPDLVVGDNEPYSGRDANYTLDVHADALGLPHVSIEVRQDLIASAADARAWARRLAPHIDAACAAAMAAPVETA